MRGLLVSTQKLFSPSEILCNMIIQCFDTHTKNHKCPLFLDIFSSAFLIYYHLVVSQVKGLKFNLNFWNLDLID